MVDTNLSQLHREFRIVNEDGTPTDYFLRVMFGNTGVTETQAATLESLEAGKADKSVVLTAGVGLEGGGDLSEDRTFALSDTSVTPGSYTNTNLTVDAQGRLIAASSGPSGAGGWGLVGSWTFSAPVANVDFTGLGSYTELLVFGRDITKSASGVTQALLSVDGGATFFNTSGNYLLISPTDGSTSNTTAIRMHQGASATAARSGGFILTRQFAAPVVPVTNAIGVADSRMFVGSSSTVDALRVNILGGGNLTGGSIWVLGR